MPMQGLGEACSSHLQESLPADGLIGQGRQKATEEAALSRSSAAAQSIDMHDSPRLCLELDSEHQVSVDADSASVATVKIASLVVSSVATTEVVPAGAMQHEYASTAQSARPEQDACLSRLPSKAPGLTLVNATVNRDHSNWDMHGHLTQELDGIAHGRQPATQDMHLQTAQVTAHATAQQGGTIAPCRARPASSSSARPASRQSPRAIKEQAVFSGNAEECGALKKPRNSLPVDQDPRQRPEGTDTSIEDMQVCHVTSN